ncbi:MULTISPECIES: LacI family DNA-binding transcriptional regulator [unclassified Brenneria]|uniref:LacI family DNA-binding transcriptional regulator n=1 Tax=unclassified Brenneria TaxID=2634434 RepID=UPI001554F6DA|nr:MULTISPECIES: LacI family DNA-binding transcriptional regulator [unclassified Brenneria]MBJ7222783.1 LacI family DNA-binding transcriptional regulator [Brenneria sp. L3-3C-1]MEE3644027.1 LacI family DNA-binding transcriptional regulator [Brenneria sp. L3_3C_1]MEE3651871.1 LacI family DNA-binding transcriptional regulator [Brenneria sp. HEZEL_4_2_4]NPD01831.1 LacI family DNA-binding transcriptional regulator [Brenneria sp. hezel4-2-4]
MENKKKNKPYKATARDVAKRAGVSKWTVSRAFTEGASISKKAKEDVLKAAKVLGYRPNLLARSLSDKNSHIIGVVADEFKNPNLMPLLDEVTQQLQRKRYMALLLNITSKANYEAVMTLADQLQVDGLLFLGTALTDDLVTLAQDIHQIPLIQLCRNNDNPYIQVVNTDGYAAGGQIAELLHQQGYTHFGYMKGPQTDTCPLLRFQGYRNKLQTLGNTVDTVLAASDYQRQCAFDVMSAYLSRTPPEQRIDALFCENDILAVGALDALRQDVRNGHIGIVGFDDIEMAASPSWALTTFSQPLSLLVSEAIERLTAEKAPGDNTYLPGKLTIRRSHLKPL